MKRGECSPRCRGFFHASDCQRGHLVTGNAKTQEPTQEELLKALKDIKKTVIENYGWKPVREGDGCVEEIKVILKGVGL